MIIDKPLFEHILQYTEKTDEENKYPVSMICGPNIGEHGGWGMLYSDGSFVERDLEGKKEFEKKCNKSSYIMQVAFARLEKKGIKIDGPGYDPFEFADHLLEECEKIKKENA